MRLRRWLQIIGFAILATLLVSALWILHSSVSFLSEAHRRNADALNVAANGLQYWPESMRGIAHSLLVSNNLDDDSVDPQREYEGWNVIYTFWTPALGRLKITYAFAGKFKHTNLNTVDSCDTLRGRIESGEKLPFVGSRSGGGEPTFEVFGKMTLAEASLLDFTKRQSDQPFSSDLVKVMTDKAGFGKHFSSRDIPDSAELCYGASVPTAKLLYYDQTKTYFSNLLIVNGAKRVVQQVGAENLPVESLDQLHGNEQELAETIKAEAAFTERGEQSAPIKPEKAPELAQALAPQIIEINDRNYYAYVRPFNLPTNLDGCGASEEPDQPPVSGKPINSGEQKSSKAQASSNCYLVGLVPQEQLWSDALQPSPLFEFTFVLVNFLLLCAFPIVRLLLMGPHESLARHTVALIMGGAVIGLSLITLAFLTWIDIALERERMLVEAKQTASQIALHAYNDLHELISDGWYNHQDPLILKHKHNPKKVNVNIEVAAIKIHPPKDSPKDRKVYIADAKNGLEPVEGIENIVNLASNGHPVGCDVAQISTHSWGTNRFEVTGRDYFKKFLSQDFSGRFDIPKKSAKTDSGNSDKDNTEAYKNVAYNNAAYIVDQVRDMTDGVNAAAVLLQPSPDERKAQETAQAQETARDAPDILPCRTAAYLITGVIGSLVAPVMTSGLEMAVVDTKDPLLPVKFDSQSERIDVEKMASEIGSNKLKELQRWLDGNAMPAYSNNHEPLPDFSFQANYDGAHRQFVARLIPGTPWLVLVSYSLDTVDLLPVTRTGRAFVSGLTLAFPMLLLWWFIAWLRPERARRLWPHENMNPHRAEGGVLGQFNYCKAAFVLCCLAIGEGSALLMSGPSAICAIAVLSSLAVMILYVETGSSPRMAGAISPANERAFKKLSIAFLCCLSVVPTVAMWQDAKSFTDEQERLRRAIEFNSYDHGIYRHLRALEDVAMTWFLAPDVKDAEGNDDHQKAIMSCDHHVFVTLSGQSCPPPPANPPTPPEPTGGKSRTFFEVLTSLYPEFLISPDLENYYKSCPRPQPPLNSFGDYFCVGDKNFGYASNHEWIPLIWSKGFYAFWFLLLPALVIVLWGTWWLLQEVLVALFGFGVPFGLSVRRRPSEPDPTYPLRDAFPYVEQRIATSAPDLNPDQRNVIECLVREAIPLPQEVLSQILDIKIEAQPKPEKAQAKPGKSDFLGFRGQIRTIAEQFLIEAKKRLERKRYPDHDEDSLNTRLDAAIEWANGVYAASCSEALYHLQDRLGEYYQACWRNLSLSEKIVLYNLARRRIINVGRAASPVGLLLQKGLIALDPAPRPMNQSFAAFVREDKQSKSIQESMAGGLSLWNSSSVIWLIMVPLSILSVCIVFYLAPIEFPTTLPIFVTGIPTLITFLTRAKTQKAN